MPRIGCSDRWCLRPARLTNRPPSAASATLSARGGCSASLKSHIREIVREIAFRAQAMKTYYMYSLLSPLPEHFVDNKLTSPLLSIPVKLRDGRQWEIAILGKEDTIIGVRIAIPKTDGENIPPDDFQRSQALRTFALDCIRITYDPSVEYFRIGNDIYSFWNFLDPGIGPDISLRIDSKINEQFQVNTEGLKVLLASPQTMRTAIHLLADGGDFRLPMQFRFLSVYKIIELHYKITPNRRFTNFIAPFLRIFEELDVSINTSSELCKYLSKLRARCAHIKLSDGELGFSHYRSDLSEASKILPVLTQIACKCIQENYPESPLRFATTPEETSELLEQMKREGLNPIKVSG